jgi:undecaprenyl diphosphate synthase
VQAAQAFAADCMAGKADVAALTEKGFSDYLYSAGLPEPELLIRPGGEQRLSNFLLWQCAYAEFYFTDVLWPDFDRSALLDAVRAYNGRERRYGGV